MIKKTLKEYFSFTKKERIAVIMLVVVAIATFLLPHLVPDKPGTSDKAALRELESQAALLRAPKQDSLKYTDENEDEDRRSFPLSGGTIAGKHARERPSLFYFDPNTLSPEEWKRLGLSDKTILTIKHYITKGGRFREPADIKKIYGLHDDEVTELLPYVRIRPGTTEARDSNRQTRFSTRDGYQRSVSQHYPATSIDVNLADTTTFIRLPGIGSKLASRIIHFRESLGGFYSVDQLAETYGLPDSTFQTIKPRLTISNSQLSLININSADVNRLKQHPYLKWNVANAIVEYRREHGSFKNIEDLLQINVMSPELFRKVAPYLTIQ